MAPAPRMKAAPFQPRQHSRGSSNDSHTGALSLMQIVGAEVGWEVEGAAVGDVGVMVGILDGACVNVGDSVGGWVSPCEAIARRGTAVTSAASSAILSGT